jgi:hypothetical protein
MNMTPTKVLTEFEALLLNKWAGDHGARVTVANDPAHAIELLTAGKTDGCAVVLFYGGDDPADDLFTADTLLRANIRIGVSQKQGLKLRSSDSVVTLLDQIASLRKTMATETVEGLVDQAVYKGMAPLTYPDGQAFSGYALRYDVLYADDVVETSETGE